MNIACPTCQSVLDAPENFLGRAVQCPKCRNVFTAENRPALPTPPPVLKPAPAPNPASPPAWDRWGNSERPREHYGGSDPYPYAPPPYSRGYGEPPPPLNETQGRFVSARAGAILASNGYLTLLAFAFYFIGLFFIPGNGGRDQDMGRVCGGISLVVILIPCALFSIAGGISLRRLKGRGIPITGVVFAYILAVLLGMVVMGFSIGLLGMLNGRQRGEPMMAMCFTWVLLLGHGIFNLIAAIMGTAALSNVHVTQMIERNSGNYS